ncbi:MAG: transglycosylase SLT domain-containing protein, partial [Solirubrobacterales bacterium]|nr:transglycosylase SLT domain-containing protein [Solirubrobacterales bacterium]
ASIHRIESGFGALNDEISTAGAVGHMQFLPETWNAYGVDANHDGRTDPHDPADAIHGAANYLRASGAPGDWYGALFTYNNADWYVDEVLLWAGLYGDVGESADAVTVECSGEGLAGGRVDLSRAVRVYEPQTYATVPARWGAYGQAEQFDARLLDNLIYVLSQYHLRLIQGRSDPGSPSETHGHGTAADMAPEPGYGWDQTALRLAEDLGWTRGCGGSGERPACDLVPAIANVYYDGFEGHGEGDHIHVGWQCACTYGGDTLAPAEWVMAFPSPAEGEAAAAGSSEILVVGDSLSVGTRPFLEAELGDRVTVNAERSRSSSAGLAVLRTELDSEEVVAFDLGTNDDAGRPAVLAESLRRARELAGDRCLVVATINKRGDGPLNRVIRDLAAGTPNTELFDWHAIAHAEGLLVDGTHSTSAGYRERAAGEIEAIAGC